MKWKLIKKKVKELKEYKDNPRILTNKGLEDLEKSIKKFGLAQPIVINTDNTICGGHGRLEILKKNKILEVDCYVPHKKLTNDQFEELNVRLNKNIAGIFDDDKLKDLFDLDQLEEWGFDDVWPDDEMLEKESNNEKEQKFMIEVTFPNENEMTNVYNQMLESGYIAKIKK